MTVDNLSVKLSPKEHKRIFKRIDYTHNGCWEWTGGKDGQGYGQGYYNGRRERVHRIMYALFNGPIPRGENRKEFQLDHLCKNKSCCNPKHLELVSQRTNVLRGNGITAQCARRKLCIHGHLLVKVKRIKTNRVRRYCPTCDSIRHKKRLQGPKREYWLKKAREASSRYRSA